MRLFLPLLAWLTRVYGLGIPLSSRQPGQFTEFQGKRVCFGSVKEVRVPLAGATREELQEYLTPERVATAMWDREKVRSLGDGCYELRMEKLSFVMLSIDSSVRVLVKTKAHVAGQRGPTRMIGRGRPNALGSPRRTVALQAASGTPAGRTLS